jgi:hypothetical protein
MIGVSGGAFAIDSGPEVAGVADRMQALGNGARHDRATCLTAPSGNHQRRYGLADWWTFATRKTPVAVSGEVATNWI